MSLLSRRKFFELGGNYAAHIFAGCALLNMTNCQYKSASSFRGKIVTVLGPIEPADFGPTLPHEHVMVDFIGADKVGKHRYDAEQIYLTMLPYLQKVADQGVSGFVDCTPMFLGRDPEILTRLARATGLHILTNTGMYKEPYLPQYAFNLPADELARQWIDEIENGIEGTNIHAGFIKIAVHKEDLKPIQQKIVRAACRTHIKTGATIACHCGFGPAAMQMLDIFTEEGVPADALIVVHAQSEKDLSYHFQIAEMGAWLEYDNIGSWPVEQHVQLIDTMVNKGYVEKILLSMDRGWYRVGEEGGGKIKPYTFLFDEFISALSRAGYKDSVIDLLTIKNPAKAFQFDSL